MPVSSEIDLSDSRVLVITGAGISAESGIPTFRGQDGLWRNFDPMKLATPEAFARDPKLVWEWYGERRKWIREAQSNPAHHAIVDLAKHARKFLLVTQNVDDLHVRAGLASDKMVQIHGDIFETRCSRCDHSHDVHNVADRKLDCLKQSSLTSVASPATIDCLKQSKLRSTDPGSTAKTNDCLKQSLAVRANEAEEKIPECEKCGGLLRPGVVWFGEQLDPRKIDIVEEFLGRGNVNLTIVIGTTALFGYITDWATRGGGRLIEINPEETPLSEFATQSLREPAGVALPRVVNRLIRSSPALQT